MLHQRNISKNRYKKIQITMLVLPMLHFIAFTLIKRDCTKK